LRQFSGEALLELANDSAEKAKSASSHATEDDFNVVLSFKIHGETLASGPRHQEIVDILHILRIMVAS
jgi:hypothetical protein